MVSVSSPASGTEKKTKMPQAWFLASEGRFAAWKGEQGKEAEEIEEMEGREGRRERA